MSEYTDEFNKFHDEYSKAEWEQFLNDRKLDMPMPRGFNDGYKERHWAFWKKSRASICVELPIEIGGTCLDHQRALLRHCKEAITKTGVRVK